MKALTFDGVGKIKVVDKDKPKIELPTQAIVKLVRTTICGTDLHIIKGDVPTVDKGRTLGHEGVGIVEEVGGEVKSFKKYFDILLDVSLYDACKNGGWQLGHLIDGTQAEYIRMPFADSCLYPVPEGLEVGVLRGYVKPGSTVAIVGAGPVGLAACICARLYSPSTIVFFDKDEFRLETAKKVGATQTYKVDNAEEARKVSKSHFADKDGFDVVIEAVGIPATFLMCQELVGIGGHIANIGVHGTKVDLHIEKLWPRSTTISMALVSSYTIPILLDLMTAGKLDTSALITHDFKFSEIEKAYDIFGRAAETKALKVNIEFD